MPARKKRPKAAPSSPKPKPQKAQKTTRSEAGPARSKSPRAQKTAPKKATRKKPPAQEPENEKPRGRSIWSGSITFGLVAIPVEFYAAHRPRQARLRMVTEDGHPVGRRYFCPRHGEPVAMEDLVRGFQLETGEMVVLSDEDIEAVAPDKTRDIDLQRFVPQADIPELMFRRGYVLAPGAQGAKAYRLLAETMEGSGRVGIATFVMREKAHVVAILAEGGVLRAEILRYASELRTPDGIGLAAPPARISRARVKVALEAVDALTQEEFDPEELSDESGKALTQLAESKAKRGVDVTRGEAEAEDDSDAPLAHAIDLVALLKERLEKSGALASPPGGTRKKAAS